MCNVPRSESGFAQRLQNSTETWKFFEVSSSSTELDVKVYFIAAPRLVVRCTGEERL